MGKAATTGRVWVAVALLAGLTLALSTALTGAGAARAAGEGISSIDVLSNRADLVSGGDALVAINLAADVDPATVQVRLNGTDITSTFAVRQDGSFSGLVTGLALGENTLIARAASGSGRVLTIKNHPIGGPVFAGEQIQPWLCRTQNQTGTTPALGPAVDTQCNAAAPVVEHFYRNLANTAWVAYNPLTPPDPSLVRQTTTDEGKTVPFVIQRVTGTADRGIYQIAVLVDATKPIEPGSTDQPWNHKYVNTFGGACSVNYTQPTVGDVRDATRLGLGFAVGTSSLNTYANSCSDVISAEALMMTKEIVAERWGPIKYTVGDGGSAGTMQQHMISGAYPGLLNGLMTNLLYEDHWFQVVDSMDCLLLSKYFGLGGAPAGWGGGGNPLFNTAALRQLVYGTNPTAPDAKCSTKIPFTATELIADSSTGCAGPTPGATWRWPTVPNGPRCTIQDYMKYVFGVGPDNKAPRPIDNVGLQYGLQNLLNGTLSVDRFVDVNWRIGGMDIDGVWQPQRTAADVEALKTLYRTGRITDGSGSANVAEIDLRNNPTDTGFHPPFHSWTWRARIDRTLGNHDNSVIWVQRSGTPPNQFESMRTWLDAVYSDPSSDPLPAKIARNKPASVKDQCYASAAQGGPQDDLFCTGTPAQWQYYSHMRLVAGWPMTLDTFKCQLKPLVRSDYRLPNGDPIVFTDEEWDKLNQAFPGGVCDFTKPAVGKQPSIPWITFASGPGGEPLGAAPTSRNGADELGNLHSTIDAMALETPLSKNLHKKIDDALKELDKGNLNTTCNRVDDLIARAIEDVGKTKPKLQVEEAKLIADDAYLAEQLLGCIPLDSNRPGSVQAVLDVIDTINGLEVTVSTENDLTTKAKEAGRRLTDGNTREACKKLDELDKTAAKKLTDEQYAMLLPAVEAARSQIGC